MKRIAFIGAPSTGKSTTAEELRKIVDIPVIEYISAGQFLKANGFGINDAGTADTGKACIFFHKLSIATLDLLKDSSDSIVILPRTILDPVIYDDVPISEEEVRNYFDKVDRIFYLPIETELEKRKDRTESEDYRKMIDEKLLGVYKKYNIEFETLKGTPAEKAKKIKEVL